MNRPVPTTRLAALCPLVGVYTGSSKVALLVLTCFFHVKVGSAQKTDASNPKQSIAAVAGQAIYEDELLPMVRGQLFPLRNQEYEIKKRALDNLIEQKLLEAAAKKKGIDTEKLLAQDHSALSTNPTIQSNVSRTSDIACGIRKTYGASATINVICVLPTSLEKEVSSPNGPKC